MTRKRYIGLIGLGFIFMWGSACMAWVDLSTSSNTAMKILGFLGASLVSISGLAIAFYTSSLEGKVRDLKKQNDANEAEMLFWKSQADTATGMIENVNNNKQGWKLQMRSWIYSILAVGTLSGFGGLWGPSSFEECRDQAARDAKTEAGMSVLIASCRKQFPKQSELKTEWAGFTRTIKGHKYDPAMPIIYAEPAMLAAKSYDYGGFFARKYGGKHMTAEGRAELLMSKEFMNWFVSQSDYVKSLLVSPMLQANEDKIFDAYGRDRDRDF